MPALLLDTLSTIGHYMSFGPLIALLSYLLFYHGQYERTNESWL